MRPMHAFVSCLILVLLSACGPQLRPTPNRTTMDLSGQWRLPEGIHDTLSSRLRTAIEQMHQKNDERERRMMRREMGESGSMPDMGPPIDGLPDRGDTPPEGRSMMSGRNWMMRDRREQTDLLVAMAVPSPALTITQHALDDLQIQPEGGALRRLDSRARSTLVNRIATFQIQSGWQADAFVVYQRDANQGITIVERYQRVGDQLKVQVLFKMAGIKEQMLDASYALQH